MQRKTIAVITARADDSEQKEILGGIAETAFSQNADVAVFSTIYNHWVSDDILTFENHIYDFFEPKRFDGVIITAEAFMDLSMLEDVCRRIIASGIPAVMIGGETEGFLSITSEDEADMEQVAEHLICVHGMTKIDILTGPASLPVSEARVSGCRNAFVKHGIPFEETHVYYGNFWNDSGEVLAARYLSGELPMPEAVICTNDYMAYGLCDALTAAGVQIPDEITVIGYDHTDNRMYHHPILTTYRRNRWQMGAKAAGFLLSSEIMLRTEENRLVCGNSCKCGVNNALLNEEIIAARIGHHHSVMHSVAQFTSNLTLCRTLAEYTAVLKEYFYLLPGADALYFCLDKAWNRAESVGEEFLNCCVSEASDSRIPEWFRREELLPALAEEREKPKIFYFTPLFFQKRLFGYTVLAYQYPQCYDFSFRDWSKTVANSLEFLRMKNDIHYLMQCQQVSTLYDALTGFYHLYEFRKIIETVEKEAAGDYFFQAVKLDFSDGGEYLYGENYRSDIVAEAAGAIKQATGKHEVCCRAAEDLFIILCKAEQGSIFSDKVKVMLHHAFCGTYDENQVVISYTETVRNADAGAVDAVCRQVKQHTAKTRAQLALRRQQPHYYTMLALRTRMQTMPKKAPSTDEICKTLCMSDGYFRVTYKKCFGVSYVQDCIHARIMLACYLLCTTTMSVYSVSLQCGYSNEKFFARQFRQSVGCSPMQYRARCC